MTDFTNTTCAEAIRCPWYPWLSDHRGGRQAPQSHFYDIIRATNQLAPQRFFNSQSPKLASRSAQAKDTARLIESGVSTISRGVFQVDDLQVEVGMMQREMTLAGPGWKAITYSWFSDPLDSSGRLTVDAIRQPAFTKYVLTRAGLAVTSSAFLYFNPSYIREGVIDVEQLFTVTDCTAEVESLQADMPDYLAYCRNLRDSTTEYLAPIGPRCCQPDRCDFYDYCWEPYAGQRTVFDIPYVPDHVRLAAVKAGVVSFADVRKAGYQLPGSDHPLTDKQRVYIDDVLDGGPPRLDKPGLRDFLATLRYPLYYLDVETFAEPVPPYDGLRPFQQTPFQFSVHVQQAPGVQPTHEGFIAEEGCDPRWGLTSHLTQTIPADACVLVFNESVEKTRLTELAEWVARGNPALADHLLAIRDNIIDLYTFLQSELYVDPARQGSNSVMQVLRDMFPDDSFLNSANFISIHNSGEAANQYVTLRKIKAAPTTGFDANTGHILSDDEFHQHQALGKGQREAFILDCRRRNGDRVRDELYAYCRMNTFAMVCILENLRQIAE